MKKMNELKVFCGSCKYINMLQGCSPIEFTCKHLNNRKEYKSKDTWLEKGEAFIKMINHPEDINKNNDCSWYFKNE